MEANHVEAEGAKKKRKSPRALAREEAKALVAASDDPFVIDVEGTDPSLALALAEAEQAMEEKAYRPRDPSKRDAAAEEKLNHRARREIKLVERERAKLNKQRGLPEDSTEDPEVEKLVEEFVLKRSTLAERRKRKKNVKKAQVATRSKRQQGTLLQNYFSRKAGEGEPPRPKPDLAQRKV